MNEAAPSQPTAGAADNAPAAIAASRSRPRPRRAAQLRLRQRADARARSPSAPTAGLRRSTATWPRNIGRRCAQPRRSSRRCCAARATASLPIATAARAGRASATLMSGGCARSATSWKATGSRRDKSVDKCRRLLVVGGRERPHSRSVTQPYVPLRVFSSFTMLEGAMEPKTIAERAAKLGFPADRAHRPQRALRRHAVQRRLHRQGRAADHRRDARRSRGPPRSAARRRSTGWCCWPRTSRAMPTSASSCRRRISTARSSRSRTSPSPRSTDFSEGLIALTAGAEGALARLIADGQQRQGGSLSRPAAGAVSRAALRRAFAPPRRRSRKRRKTR